MFTPRDSQLRISRRRTNQKLPALPFSQSGDAPGFARLDATDTVTRSWGSLVGTVDGMF
jgi:hypothetical protein